MEGAGGSVARKKALKSPLSRPMRTTHGREGHEMSAWAALDGAWIAAVLLASGLLWLRTARHRRSRTIAGMLNGRPPCAQRTD